MWWQIVLALSCLFVGVSLRWGPQFAIGLMLPIVYLFPAWLILPMFEGPPDSIYGTGPDIKLAVGAACLVLYCVMPGRTFPLRFVPCDLAVLLLIGTHLLSDTLQEGLDWIILGRAYSEWYLPYVMGRLAIQSRTDVERLWRPMVCLGLVFAAAAVLEALRDVNVFESFFGQRPVEGTSRDASRWGIQRAYGPTMHSLYFGVIQLMLLGWAWLAVFRAFLRREKWFWALALVPVFLGIAATASRGPILCAAISLFVLLFTLVPRSRIPVLIAVGLTLWLGAYKMDLVMDTLDSWSGDLSQKKELALGDEALTETASRNRVNIFSVYRIALYRAGLIGYGTKAVSGFPVNIPFGEEELKVLGMARFVDNSYILVTLRFGMFGLVAFVCAAGAAVVQLLWVADRYQGQLPQHFAGCLAATLICALGAIFIVWMPYEIGYLLMWNFGLSSGLLVADLEIQLESDQ